MKIFSDASDNQADDADVVERYVEEKFVMADDDIMEKYRYEALNETSIVLDASDHLFKRKLAFLLDSGYRWCAETSSYMPKHLD